MQKHDPQTQKLDPQISNSMVSNLNLNIRTFKKTFETFHSIESNLELESQQSNLQTEPSNDPFVARGQT